MKDFKEWWRCQEYLGGSPMEAAEIAFDDRMEVLELLVENIVDARRIIRVSKDIFEKEGRMELAKGCDIYLAKLQLLDEGISSR